MAPIQMTAAVVQEACDLGEADSGDALDCMAAYANASAEDLMMMHDALHLGNWTRAIVRGRAVMIVPYHQTGRRRKVLVFRERQPWEPSPSGLL
ncbi:hypothetical protein HYH02_010024 [Chlamydomonas schloesseri]|uniref:Uncharacterized protein n=1 Tax=Chlamydomonas schloesseri TaxID=2026947 RepID=A0A835TCA4_9CHLO|nr:hypothetical protein HYH02_010024 [Chlamydomonas schloesseri]|eukprot:KAG2441436.1 hypothetical protein HYH02_010024 [Chlamydomonas schloesseri]